MSPTFFAIREADNKKDSAEIHRIFASITTEQLNEAVSIDPGSTLLHRIIQTFDLDNEYQHLVIGLFDSPNVDPSQLNINHQHTTHGRTALMLAAYKGKFEVVKRLMSLGADMQITTHDNRTAFGMACWWGQLEIVQYFLPQVELREFSLRNREGLTIIEVVERHIPELLQGKPYLELMKLLAVSYEEKLAEHCSKTGKLISKKGSKVA